MAQLREQDITQPLGLALQSSATSQPEISREGTVTWAGDWFMPSTALKIVEDSFKAKGIPVYNKGDKLVVVPSKDKPPITIQYDPIQNKYIYHDKDYLEVAKSIFDANDAAREAMRRKAYNESLPKPIPTLNPMFAVWYAMHPEDATFTEKVVVDKRLVDNKTYKQVDLTPEEQERLPIGMTVAERERQLELWDIVVGVGTPILGLLDYVFGKPSRAWQGVVLAAQTADSPSDFLEKAARNAYLGAVKDKEFLPYITDNIIEGIGVLTGNPQLTGQLSADTKAYIDFGVGFLTDVMNPFFKAMGIAARVGLPVIGKASLKLTPQGEVAKELFSIVMKDRFNIPFKENVERLVEASRKMGRPYIGEIVTKEGPKAAARYLQMKEFQPFVTAMEDIARGTKTLFDVPFGKFGEKAGLKYLVKGGNKVAMMWWRTLEKLQEKMPFYAKTRTYLNWMFNPESRAAHTPLSKLAATYQKVYRKIEDELATLAHTDNEDVFFKVLKDLERKNKKIYEDINKGADFAEMQERARQHYEMIHLTDQQFEVVKMARDLVILNNKLWSDQRLDELGKLMEKFDKIPEPYKDYFMMYVSWDKPQPEHIYSAIATKISKTPEEFGHYISELNEAGGDIAKTTIGKNPRYMQIIEDLSNPPTEVRELADGVSKWFKGLAEEGEKLGILKRTVGDKKYEYVHKETGTPIVKVNRTITGEGEEVVYRYSPNYFDIEELNPFKDFKPDPTKRRDIFKIREPRLNELITDSFLRDLSVYDEVVANKIVKFLDDNLENILKSSPKTVKYLKATKKLNQVSNTFIRTIRQAVREIAKEVEDKIPESVAGLKRLKTLKKIDSKQMYKIIDDALVKAYEKIGLTKKDLANIGFSSKVRKKYIRQLIDDKITPFDIADQINMAYRQRVLGSKFKYLMDLYKKKNYNAMIQKWVKSGSKSLKKRIENVALKLPESERKAYIDRMVNKIPLIKGDPFVDLIGSNRLLNEMPRGLYLELRKEWKKGGYSAVKKRLEELRSASRDGYIGFVNLGEKISPESKTARYRVDQAETWVYDKRTKKYYFVEPMTAAEYPDMILDTPYVTSSYLKKMSIARIKKLFEQEVEELYNTYAIPKPHKDIINMYRKAFFSGWGGMTEVAKMKKANDFLSKFIDPTIDTWKILQTVISPRWYKGNFVGNKFNLWMGGALTTKSQLLAHKAMTLKVLYDLGVLPEKALQHTVTIGKTTYKIGELLDLAERFGVITRGFVDLEMAGALRQIKMNYKEFLEAKDFKLPLFKKVMHALVEPARFMENIDRFAGWVKFLGDGHDPYFAAKKMFMLLFDYDNLTTFEKTILQRIIPFYTWFKKNTVLQLMKMFQYDKRSVIAYSIARGLSYPMWYEHEPEDLPDFMRVPGNVRMRIGKTDYIWNPVRDWPIFQVYMLLNPKLAVKGQFLEAFSQAARDLIFNVPTVSMSETIRGQHPYTKSLDDPTKYFDKAFGVYLYNRHGGLAYVPGKGDESEKNKYLVPVLNVLRFLSKLIGPLHLTSVAQNMLSDNNLPTRQEKALAMMLYIFLGMYPEFDNPDIAKKAARRIFKEVTEKELYIPYYKIAKDMVMGRITPEEGARIMSKISQKLMLDDLGLMNMPKLKLKSVTNMDEFRFDKENIERYRKVLEEQDKTIDELEDFYYIIGE